MFLQKYIQRTKMLDCFDFSKVRLKMMNPAAQPNTVIIQAAPRPRPQREPLQYNGVPFIVVGSIQVIGCIIAIIFQAVLIHYDPEFGPLSAGIWCGLCVSKIHA